MKRLQKWILDIEREKTPLSTKLSVTALGLKIFQAYITYYPEDTTEDVHTEHCCSRHGCKYGRDDCPVEAGLKPQSHPCEACDFENEES